MDIPRLRDAYVCREMMYNVTYGQLRKELIYGLKQGSQSASRVATKLIDEARYPTWPGVTYDGHLGGRRLQCGTQQNADHGP